MSSVVFFLEFVLTSSHTTLTLSTMSTLPMELPCHLTLLLLPSPPAGSTHTDLMMMGTALALFTLAVLPA